MDWMQVLFLFFANASLIVWFRSESRSDNRNLESSMLANDRRVLDLIECIKYEMRDFHGRLCAIEERRRK
jgi:hypothetical protein